MKRDETAVRIIQAADHLFLTHGYTRVSVDEIATSLGMSKKTIYKHFPSKEALLQAGIDAFAHEITVGTTAILALENIPFSEKADRFIQFVGSKISRIQNPHATDIQRTAPKVWQHVKTLQRQNIHEKFGALLTEGVEQGVIRPDVNLALVQIMIWGALEKLILPEQAANLPLTNSEILQMSTHIILNGILE